MSWDDSEEGVAFRVVVNHEEQYSILAEYEMNPPGWTDEGKTGTKRECLQYILEVWTDMRPVSLRKKMDEMFGKTKAN